MLAPASAAVGDWASVARDHWSHPILRKIVSDLKLTQVQSVTSPWLSHPPDRCQELPSSGTNTADELFPGRRRLREKPWVVGKSTGIPSAVTGF